MVKEVLTEGKLFGFWLFSSPKIFERERGWV
jgi:hypothetical protein